MAEPTLPPSLRQVPNIELRDQTVEQLHAERDYWQGKIDKATGWGAAVGFASKMVRNCERELARRSANG